MGQDSADERTQGPVDRLKAEATDLIGAFGDRTVSSIREKIEDATERLTDYTKGAATPALKTAVSGGKSLAEGKSPVGAVVNAGTTAAKEKVGKMFGKGDGGGDNNKVTNIVESIDVGVPVKLAYDQWTQFTDFPSFMRKVENVEQQEDQKVTWRAQILWSHRTWESTILEQMPDDKIVWRSQGDKGYVDGAVTFHELAPNLTRILVALEYHPKGLVEHIGNLWKAPGRRVRLELKHFRRHVMTEALLHSDEVEGWRGVISQGDVQKQKQGTKSSGRKKADSGDKGSSRRSPASRTTSASQRSGSSGKASTSAASSARTRSAGSGSKAASGSGRKAGTAGSASRSGGTGPSSGSGGTRGRSTQTASRTKKAS